MSWGRSFLKSRKGAIAPLAAIMVTAAVAAGAGAIKVANIYRARDSLQQAADAAALATARAYDSQRNSTTAVDLGKRVLAKGVPQGFSMDGAPSVTVGIDSATRITTARVKATVKDTTNFLRLPSFEPLKANVAAEAQIGGYRDLYLVMMLDVTGSMSSLITSAKAAMTNLESQLRNAMAQQGQSFAKLYVKVVFFRDMRTDGSQSWYETRVYDMSKLTEQTALQGQIAAQYASGGGDGPESGPSAIAYALTAPIETPIDKNNVFQLIALWTDAYGIPLGPEDVSYAQSRGAYLSLYNQYDDYSVYLWKYLSSSGLYPPSYRVSETSYAKSITKCCASMAELEREWRNGGTVKASNRALALFAPTSAYPWKEMSAWPSAELTDYLSASGTSTNLINGLVGSLTSMSVNLRVSR